MDTGMRSELPLTLDVGSVPLSGAGPSTRMILVFPAVLFGLALGLMAWHVGAWRAVRDREKDEIERQFQWRRFRRRMQASGMLGLVAVAAAVGLLVPKERQPSLFVYVWFGVFLVTMWILLLALADALATRSHAIRLRLEHQVEHARLKAELERIQERHLGSEH